MAWYCGKPPDRPQDNHTQHRVSALRRNSPPGWPITIRGGGDPSRNMVIEPFVRMGPPPRSLAAEANDCFMVRPQHGANRIQGCNAKSRVPTAGSPRVIQTAQPAGASGGAVTPT